MGASSIRFIADLHLPVSQAGRGEAPLAASPERRASALTGVFAEFLAETAEECRALYVLGDLFDFWYEAGGRPPRGSDRVLGAMRDAASGGLRIVVLHGNRDFLLGPAFCRATGAELASEEIEIALAGKRVHLTHGDLLVRGDHRYRVWRRFSRGGAFRRTANGLPSWLAERVARALRLGSEFEKSVKPRTVMAYSKSALGARIAAGADVIVAGHVHQAAELVVEAGGGAGRLFVLGAWDERRGTYAEWTDGTMAMHTFAGG